MAAATLNLLLDQLEDEGLSESIDDLYEAFADWAEESGRPLYPHQEDALLELLDGNHVIAQTPTGSGKSLIALAAHFISLARGGRSYYTAPLKALVSEKFFELVDAFGAANVGMVTGDVALNPLAPIICCTAEILSNQSLREGEGLDCDMVIMDEFHFYGDPQRGWAWQVPLLELPAPQFVFLSATLGDTSQIAADLKERTGRETSLISDAQRPVPLEYEYLVDELGPVVERLIKESRSPIYVVHFTQNDAVKTAVSLSRTLDLPKDIRSEIQAALRGVELARGFGKTLRELLLKGIAVHHAGMLPRYRRLVERLAQRGLLQVICGTDTLGVGINVPIRCVLFTSLVKYDGARMRHLSAREFHQIAGRAGRPGFDTIGYVKALAAPEEIESLARRARMTAAQEAGDRKKQKKMAKRGLAPKKQGELSWTKATFERLTEAQPEVLRPRFHTSHSVFLNVLAGPGNPEARLLRLGRDAADSAHVGAEEAASNRFLREFGDIYRSLLQAGLIERVPKGQREGGSAIKVVRDLPDDFALNQPLAPFALAALDLLDPESPTFAIDVVSVIESVMEDPRQLLYAQQRMARDRAFQTMREEGLDYEQRRDALAEISWPKPLEEIIKPSFTTFAQTNPWVKGHEPSPKRVVREMVEDGLTFSLLVGRYDLNNSEGVVLRYLSDTYKALRQILPAHYQTDEVQGIIDWLGELLTSVDTSLLAEWQQMMEARVSGTELQSLSRADDTGAEGSERAFGEGEDGQIRFSTNRHALRTAVRNEMFRRVELLSRDNCTRLAAAEPEGSPWDQARFESALDPYWDEFEWMRIDQQARAAELFEMLESPEEDAVLDAFGIEDPEQVPLTATEDRNWWVVRQIVSDPEDSGAWRLTAVLDVPEALVNNTIVLRTTSFASLS
ncbi:DEAD/DEAH box helicase [Actinomyces minihominis]|uniref:DEAD/DEAH box helicase n=1 Tax=Actinomyces minihominis TaxID=2002838 RepID=UPI000C08003A|nr:DUF3516 domain-containing protein [Actinomyces minihominis]